VPPPKPSAIADTPSQIALILIKIRLAQAAFERARRMEFYRPAQSSEERSRRALVAHPRKPFVPLLCLVQKPSPAKSSENKAIVLGANRRRPGSGKQSRRELKAALLFDPLGGRIAFAKYHSPSCVGLPSGGAGERICGRVATGIPARSVGFF
jgi:hypothetical protein